MTSQLYLDLDGVLVDFLCTALAVHRKEDFFEDPTHKGLWDIEEPVAGTKSLFWAPLEGPEFWRSLEKLPEADKIVEWCERKVGQENISILTAPSSSPHCKPGKIEWVGKYYPQFVDRVIFAKSKHHWASPTSYLVDDRDKNVEDWRRAGGRGLLVPQVWNSGWPVEKEKLDFLEEQWEGYERGTNGLHTN